VFVAVPVGGVVLGVVAQHLLGPFQRVVLAVVVGDAGRAFRASTAGRFLVVPTAGVSAKLEDDGIAVACRGQSAVLTSEEAREIAAGLEQVALNEGWQDKETDDLVEFLRYVADVLDGTPHPFQPETDFGRWG